MGEGSIMPPSRQTRGRKYVDVLQLVGFRILMNFVSAQTSQKIFNFVNLHFRTRKGAPNALQRIFLVSPRSQHISFAGLKL